MSRDLPLIEVEERDYAPASQWQHRLDRQIHGKATEKAWCGSVQIAPQLDAIPFEPVGTTARPVISQHHRGSAKRRTGEKPSFPFVV